jgi:hypothetical protein
VWIFGARLDNETSVKDYAKTSLPVSEIPGLKREPLILRALGPRRARKSVRSLRVPNLDNPAVFLNPHLF